MTEYSMSSNFMVVFVLETELSVPVHLQSFIIINIIITNNTIYYSAC